MSQKTRNLKESAIDFVIMSPLMFFPLFEKTAETAQPAGILQSIPSFNIFSPLKIKSVREQP